MFSFQVVACKASRLNQLLIWYRSSIITICLVSSFNLEIIFLYVLQTTTLQKNVVCMWLLLTNKSYIHPFLFLVPSDNHQLSHSQLCGFPTSLFSAPSADSHRGTFSTTTKHSIRPNDNDDTSTGLEIAFERPSSPTLASGKTGGSRAVQLAPQALVSWLRLLLLAHTTRMNASSRRLASPKCFFSPSLSSLIFFFCYYTNDYLRIDYSSACDWWLGREARSASR